MTSRIVLAAGVPAAVPIALAVALCLAAAAIHRDATARRREGRPVRGMLFGIEFETPSDWALGALVLSVLVIPLYLAARTR